MNDYVAWFDGACEPFNPGGTATSGAIVKGNDGTVLLEEGRLVGKGEGMSNNVAEYAAIIRVFKYLLSRSPGHVIVHGDSNLVINQLNGKWAARKGLYYSTYLEAREFLGRLRSLGWQVDLLWIPRTKNEGCDALTKGALAEAGVQPEIQPSSIPLPSPWAQPKIACCLPLRGV
jgi:ribonuclease HI